MIATPGLHLRRVHAVSVSVRWRTGQISASSTPEPGGGTPRRSLPPAATTTATSAQVPQFDNSRGVRAHVEIIERLEKLEEALERLEQRHEEDVTELGAIIDELKTQNDVLSAGKPCTKHLGRWQSPLPNHSRPSRISVGARKKLCVDVYSFFVEVDSLKTGTATPSLLVYLALSGSIAHWLNVLNAGHLLLFVSHQASRSYGRKHRHVPTKPRCHPVAVGV